MRKFFLFLISLFFGIGLFVWIIKTVGWQEIKLVFISFSGWQGLIILGLTIITVLFGVWKWRFILKSQGHNIPIIELVKTYLAGNAISFLAPMLLFGGELFRGYSLKEKHSIPWESAISSVMIDRILETTLYLLTIFLGLIYFLFKIGLPPKNLGIILGATLIFFGGATAIFYFKSFRRESIIKSFLRAFNSKSNEQNSLVEIEKEIFNFFGPKKKKMWQGFGLSFLRVFSNLARFWILIIFLGKSIGFLSAVSILGFFYLAVMLPIPAALGSHEAVQSFAFNGLGLGANTGTALALIIRGAELIMVLIGAMFFLRLGFQLLEIAFVGRIKKFMNSR